MLVRDDTRIAQEVQHIQMFSLPCRVSASLRVAIESLEELLLAGTQCSAPQESWGASEDLLVLIMVAHSGGTVSPAAGSILQMKSSTPQIKYSLLLSPVSWRAGSLCRAASALSANSVPLASLVW